MDLSKFAGWMQKSGWKGEGLGKNEDGLVKAIHVERKNNTTGIGATKFQWDNLWWDNVYSSTSIKIGGDNQEDLFDTKETLSTVEITGVKKTVDKMTKVELKEYKRQTALEKQIEREKKKDNLYFGTFTKATILSAESYNDTTTQDDDNNNNNNNNNSSKNDDDEKPPQEKLNDVSNDVFLACQGRVLRKYTPIGKLQRLKDQEEGKFSVEKLNNNTNVYKSSENKIETSKSKRKLDQIDDNSNNKSDNSKDNNDIEKPLKKSKKEKKDKEDSNSSSSSKKEKKSSKSS